MNALLAFFSISSNGANQPARATEANTSYLERTLTRSIILFLLAFTSGCEKSTVSVDVHGVNYGGNEFFYSIIDPDTQRPSGVGEHIAPYAGSGITCCFTLPKKWRPGIKVQLFIRHWLPQSPDGSLPKVDRNETVEVPPYIDDKPGELWIIRSAEGAISVVSSIYEPDHPKWPGKIRGWPVPSIEYQREQWEMYRKYEQQGVDMYISLLDDLKRRPEKTTKEAWKSAKEHDPESLKAFAGPDDPQYAAALKIRYEYGLALCRERLENVMRTRP